MVPAVPVFRPARLYGIVLNCVLSSVSLVFCSLLYNDWTASRSFPVQNWTGGRQD
jgi:hypothetical protein